MILKLHTDSSFLGNIGFLISVIPAVLFLLAFAPSLTHTVLFIILFIPLIIYPLLDFISIFKILIIEKRYLKKIAILCLIVFSETALIMILTGSTHNQIGLLIFIVLPTAFISFLILKHDGTTDALLNTYIINSKSYRLVFCKICGKFYNDSPSICLECKNSQLFRGNMIDHKAMLLSFYTYKYGPYFAISLLLLSILFTSMFLYVVGFSLAGLAVVSRNRNRHKYNIYGRHTPNKKAQIITKSLRSKRPIFGIKEIAMEFAIPLLIVVSSLIYLIS